MSIFIVWVLFYSSYDFFVFSTAKSVFVEETSFVLVFPRSNAFEKLDKNRESGNHNE